MTRTHKKLWMGGLLMAMVAALVVPTVALAAGGPPDGRGAGRGGFMQQSAFVVTGELDADEQAALTEFLIDEHHALATYEAVMAQFGEVQPFASIARAERQHIAALESVFTRYGVALPSIPSFDVPTFESAEDACAAAAQAEIDNAALYDRLMSTIDNPDVLRVAENLRNASLNHHLPAFEACAEGTYTPGLQAGPRGRGGLGRMGGWSNSDAPRGYGTCIRTETTTD